MNLLLYDVHAPVRLSTHLLALYTSIGSQGVRLEIYKRPTNGIGRCSGMLPHRQSGVEQAGIEADFQADGQVVSQVWNKILLRQVCRQ